MAVHTTNTEFGKDGHGDSIADFKAAHEQNTRGLLNLSEDKKVNDPRPPYNPNDPDNKWPRMLHHAGKGELTVGKSLVGIIDPATRQRIEKANTDEMEKLKKLGYRDEPFPKAQIAILDPVAEKSALLKRNEELQGQIVSAHDLLQKMDERLKTVEIAKPAEVTK